ncbi:PREDICTED: zinc finger and SCAN domain-containing protein 5B-like [Chrysochloris asiatica]|uniref:Zinc finger and SCAN domain-containing protein 5B-like n=1 Tax=Chrysochloris asiatica TaxID=185453 RepID=A0A9B0U7Q9_CHRAS|nr:PREDICTED: zinc finger and SCAN domain-containing protein 5B-like [Chrysochloris asiatica]
MAVELTSSWNYEKAGASPGSQSSQLMSSQGTHLGKPDCNSENWHVTFRSFSWSEDTDPIRALQRLCSVCYLWLRPDLHTKEQILDKLVLEQFMVHMPVSLQILVTESGVENCQDLEKILRNNRRLNPSGQKLPPETISIKGELESLRSEKNLEENLMPDRNRSTLGDAQELLKGPDQESTRRSPYQCKYCKKMFIYKSQFDIHQRTHTGERPFKCSSCGKGFIQPSDVRVHQRIHTGEKPFKCDICHREFTHESTLHGHKRVHTNERPYHCTVCGKRFSHKGNLNVHQRIHTGAKPYVCPQCGHTFRQLGTLQRHKKMHL